jgi:hypothetical protein
LIAECSLVDNGDHDAFAVVDLLVEYAASGAGLAGATASLMVQPFSLGCLSGCDSLDEFGEFVAAHPGQHWVG